MKEEEEVVKKRFNFAKLLVFLLIAYIIGYNIYRVIKSPINNIYIENNKYLSDQEIIDIAGIRNYPSFILTFKYKIKNNLFKNKFIKSVKVNKNIGNILTISVEENTPLFIYNNKVVLSNGEQVDNNKYKLPSLVGNLNDDILFKFSEKYQNINDEIKFMISEIKYDPNNIDKERFLITMNDGNYVYVTLYKITAINEYLKILSKVNKKGILYLDSGNFFEEIN